MENEKTEQSQKGIGLLSLLLVLFVGTASFYMNISFYKSSIATTGIIIGFKEKGNKQPIVKFENQEGITVEGTPKGGARNDFINYRLGDEVTVRYQIDKEENFQLAFWLNLGVLFMMIFVFFHIALGTFLYPSETTFAKYTYLVTAITLSLGILLMLLTITYTMYMEDKIFMEESVLTQAKVVGFYSSMCTKKEGRKNRKKTVKYTCYKLKAEFMTKDMETKTVSLGQYDKVPNDMYLKTVPIRYRTHNFADARMGDKPKPFYFIPFSFFLLIFFPIFNRKKT